MGPLDTPFDISNDVKLSGLLLVYPLGSTYDRVIGSDEVIKLVLFDGNIIGNILGDVDGITLGIDVGTETIPLDGSFDGYNDVKL